MKIFVLLFFAASISGCAAISSLIAGPATPYQTQVIQLCNSPAVKLDAKLATALAPLCAAPPAQIATAAQTQALAAALQASLNKGG